MSKSIIKIDEVIDGEVVDNLPAIWEPPPHWVPSPRAVKRRIRRRELKKQDAKYRESLEKKRLARQANQEWAIADYQATIENSRMPMTNVHWHGTNPPMKQRTIKLILIAITASIILCSALILLNLRFPA